MRLEPASCFSHYIELLASFTFETRQQSFAAPVTIDVRRVKEVYPAIKRPMQSSYGVLIPDINHVPPMAQAPKLIVETL
jgi:hypothetical protein